MNKEEIEHISSGMKDRKTILRLIEFIISFGVDIYQQNVSISDKKCDNMYNKISNIDLKDDMLLVKDKELRDKNIEILIRIASIFEKMLENETFINTFNIKEKCISYILSVYGKLGFNLNNKNKDWSKNFYDLLESLPINFLLSTLIGLNTHKFPQWMRSIACKELTKITTRSGGIIAIVEFMKTLPYENNITINNLNKVVSLITSIPKDIQDEVYIKTISSELLLMLDYPSEKSYLFQTSGQIISILLLKYPEITYNYVISKIIDPLYAPKQNQDEEFIDIVIKRIERVILQPDSNIIINIVSPIFIVLWAASCFSHKTHKYIWRDRINSILLSYIVVSDKITSIFKIIENFLSTGSRYFSFANGEYGGISIEINDSDAILSIEDIDFRIENFGFLIEKFRDDHRLIEDIFLRLLSYWLNKDKSLTQEQNPMNKLSYLRILMLIQNNYLKELIKNTERILQILVDVICNFIENYKQVHKQNFKGIDSPSLNNLHNIVKNNLHLRITDEDINVIIISLNILNIILVDNSELSEKEVLLLDTIYHQLIFMVENSMEPLKSYCENLNILVKSYLTQPIISHQNKNSQVESSKEKYKKAIKYIYDSFVPIRAQGISLLKEMIEAKDSIIDVNETLTVLIGLLKDDDSFVYLNAINCLFSLANSHGNYITEYLLSEYGNTSKYNLDERIRIGDVLFKIIQRYGETINNKMSDSIAVTMLDISACSTNDIRLRSSALNLLGAACNYSPYGMGQWCFRALELTFGILNFEKAEEYVMVRRAAIMVISNIFQGIDDVSFIPSNLLRTALKIIRYIQVTDHDILMRRQASGLLDVMKGKLEENINIYSSDTVLNILV
ncbi:hypothetical protein PCANB_002639 [Pneumocystis canis]|nr:hypothetical protein PCANB_002639 [Pneumocystis canis]